MSPDIIKNKNVIKVMMNISMLPVSTKVGIIAADVPTAITNDKIKMKADNTFMVLMTLFITKNFLYTRVCLS